MVGKARAGNREDEFMSIAVRCGRSKAAALCPNLSRNRLGHAGFETV